MKKIGYLTMTAALFFSQSLLALTDAEIEARLNEYAAKIKVLEAELAKAKKTPVYEQDVGASSSTRLEKKIARIQDKMDDDAQKIRMNGFITTGVSVADEALGTAYKFDDKPSFVGDSKIGLQFDYKINDKTNATIQLVSRSRGRNSFGGDDSWNVATEWAYIGYQVTDSLKVRMGRLRVPFYMYSETLDVGYSYPWVRPPMDVYNTIFNTYDGADALYRFSTGSVNHQLQFYASGSAVTTLDDHHFHNALSIADMYGLNLTSSWGSWTARLMATTIGIEGNAVITNYNRLPNASLPTIGSLAGGTATCLDDPLTDSVAFGGDPTQCDQWSLSVPVNETINYYAAGLQYDNGSLFVIAEGVALRNKYETLFGDEDTAYITTGYRIGQWTPYVTYSYSNETRSASEATASCAIPGYGIAVCDSANYPTARQMASLGVRYELGSGVAAKFQWDHAYSMEGAGSFDPDLVTGQADGSGVENLDPQNIYTFTLDAVF